MVWEAAGAVLGGVQHILILVLLVVSARIA
jgi:hypothetical protein